MSNHFENATRFFHACESLEGWAGCRQWATEDASFTAQCEPLTDISTAEGYCDWMAGLGKGPLAGCSYALNSAAYDEDRRTAHFFGTFTGTHTAAGGPVDPTEKTTTTHYVYIIELDEQARVHRMTKIWNAPWALKELGWA